MSNRWVISWLAIDYWRWSMSNRWVIEAPKFCGLSIIHRWHRLLIDVIDYSSITHRLFIDYYTAHSLRRIFPCIWRSWRSCFTGKRKRAASSTANRRTKFSHLQKMALEALYKDSKYPSHGVIEEFAKLNNLDGATVKVWFNNKRQRDTGEPSEL